MEKALDDHLTSTGFITPELIEDHVKNAVYKRVFKAEVQMYNGCLLFDLVN